MPGSATRKKPYRGGGQRKGCQSHCIVWYETMQPGRMIQRCPHCATTFKNIEMAELYYPQELIKEQARQSQVGHAKQCAVGRRVVR